MDYAIKRASRIYSVAVPAVVLTLLIDLAMAYWRLSPGGYGYQLHRPWLYAAIGLTFAGTFWSLSEPLFSNVPYWSLDYEVWYYVLFAVLIFARGIPRWVGILGVLALIGPKMWLLFPIWLGGVAVCRLHQSCRLPQNWARLSALAVISFFIVLKVLQWEDPINGLGQSLIAGLVPFPIGFSQWYLGDYVVGILTMTLVFGLGSAELTVPNWLLPLVTGLANLSFGLYLMHFPFLLFFGSLLAEHGWIAIILSFACTMTFAAIVEPQKNRLRRLLTGMSALRLRT